MAEIAALDRAREETETAARSAELEIRASASTIGRDLASLDQFRRRALSEIVHIAGRRQEASQRSAKQQAAMPEARRPLRLLEKLRERRLTEWEVARDREFDEIANEAFLSGWNRLQCEQFYGQFHNEF